MRINRWQEFILQALRDAGRPLTLKQLVMESEVKDFAHRSAFPYNTINARLLELCASNRARRVGRATFELV